MLRTTTHPVAHTHRGKSTITGLGWRAQDASPPTVPPPNTLSGENQAAKTSLSKPMGGRFEKSRLMVEQAIHFNDGDVCERTMGVWSRLAGELFLDWLKPRPGMRWIDVGCGSGAFTELLVQRGASAETQGIDPSEAQLAFARTRPAAHGAEFLQGDAMALPFPHDRFDAAVMALVIFFVPDPAKGVAEMARVVRPGGAVAAYAWDMLGGGSPWEPIQVEMRAVGCQAAAPTKCGCLANGGATGLVGGRGIGCH